jgi:glutathione synthase/RimK-type ligase-like ATP-grasp enzyme
MRVYIQIRIQALQLHIAKKIGMTVPKTFISNNPADVKRFLENNRDMKMIMKAVGSSFYRATEDEGGNMAIYTRLINTDQVLENINSVSNCPVIFQEAICEKIDLRATVVDDHIFTVSITHEEDLGAGEDNLDWRNHKLERIYTPFELPECVEKQCVEIVKKLGLRFGAVDLCFSEDKYYFFEINPQGQWVPTEIAAGLPVSKALAKLLVGC